MWRGEGAGIDEVRVFPVRTVEPGARMHGSWSRNGSRFRVRVPFARGTSSYGTGEVPGPLLRNGRRTNLWNTAAFGYDERTPALYQSHPWVLVLARAGSIVPVIEPCAHAPRRFGPVLTLHVFPDRSGAAAGRLYEDAGEGTRFRRGDFRDSRFRAGLVRGALAIETETAGARPPMRRGTRLVVHGSGAS